MLDELRDLENIESGKQKGHLDIQGFREEISNRGIRSADELSKKIQFLKAKLKVKDKTKEGEGPELTSSQIMDQKFNLLERADQFLTPEQIKQKRIQKMQKTAAVLREEKKKAQAEAKENLQLLKTSDKKLTYLKDLYV